MDGQALEACSYDNKQCMIEMAFFFPFTVVSVYIYFSQGTHLYLLYDVWAVFGYSFSFVIHFKEDV